MNATAGGRCVYNSNTSGPPRVIRFVRCEANLAHEARAHYFFGCGPQGRQGWLRCLYDRGLAISGRTLGVGRDKGVGGFRDPFLGFWGLPHVDRLPVRAHHDSGSDSSLFPGKAGTEMRTITLGDQAPNQRPSLDAAGASCSHSEVYSRSASEAGRYTSLHA